MLCEIEQVGERAAKGEKNEQMNNEYVTEGELDTEEGKEGMNYW